MATGTIKNTCAKADNANTAKRLELKAQIASGGSTQFNFQAANNCIIFCNGAKGAGVRGVLFVYVNGSGNIGLSKIYPSDETDLKVTCSYASSKLTVTNSSNQIALISVLPTYTKDITLA